MTARIWLDDQPLGDWTAPRSTRPVWVVLAVVVALTVVLGGLWAAGGLDERTDDVITVQPGETFETGPFQLVFTDAQIWERRYRDGPREGWRIRVYGLGRTTADRSGQLSSRWTAIGVDGSGFAENATVSLVGQIRAYGAQFQPGMPMVPVELQVELPPEFAPSDFIDLRIAWLETENRSNTGHPEADVLVPSRHSYQVRLPMVQGLGDPPR